MALRLLPRLAARRALAAAGTGAARARGAAGAGAVGAAVGAAAAWRGACSAAGGAAGGAEPAKMHIVFTCGQCGTRAVKTFAKRSYEEGVVIARCPGCQAQHLIADNLGWFGEERNIEQILAKQGVQVPVLGADGEWGPPEPAAPDAAAPEAPAHAPAAPANAPAAPAAAAAAAAAASSKRS